MFVYCPLQTRAGRDKDLADQNGQVRRQLLPPSTLEPSRFMATRRHIMLRAKRERGGLGLVPWENGRRRAEYNRLVMNVRSVLGREVNPQCNARAYPVTVPELSMSMIVRGIDVGLRFFRIESVPVPSYTRLPPGSHGILNDEWIGCEQHAVVLDGLANQHPVERVAVQYGKLVQVKHCAFFKRQNSYSVLLSLFQYKLIERSRHGQLSK